MESLRLPASRATWLRFPQLQNKRLVQQVGCGDWATSSFMFVVVYYPHVTQEVCTQRFFEFFVYSKQAVAEKNTRAPPSTFGGEELEGPFGHTTMKLSQDFVPVIPIHGAERVCRQSHAHVYIGHGENQHVWSEVLSFLPPRGLCFPRISHTGRVEINSKRLRQVCRH